MPASRACYLKGQGLIRARVETIPACIQLTHFPSPILKDFFSNFLFIPDGSVQGGNGTGLCSLVAGQYNHGQALSFFARVARWPLTLLPC